MKKILYSFLVCLLFVFTSCEKDSQDTSKITYYVTYNMKGEQTIVIPLGTKYVEPGVIAMEGDKDVTSSMKISGVVNSNVAGQYTLTYSTLNVDGYSSSIDRTVFVYDPAITTDLSGKYSVAAGTYRLYNGAKVSYSGFSVDLAKIAPGIFSVSDFFGGYYYPRLTGYTTANCMTGYVKLNPDNTIELLSSKVEKWGDSLNGLNNASYQSSTNSIHWEPVYVGTMKFFIDLNK